jgi:hypothetical protein
MKYLCSIIPTLFLAYYSIAFSQVNSEAFIVRSHDQKVEVIAPKKFHPEQVVMVENRTTQDLIGYVQTQDGKNKVHLRVKPSKYVSVSLPGQNAQRFVFVPLSPPFQEVELVVGREVYEIPAKR